MSTKTNLQTSYSSMHNTDDQLFSDEHITRYDADTIKHRYGDNWRNYASNIREIKQADGTIVREYIIEDPSLLKPIKPSVVDSTSSTTASDDDQHLTKHKFAQIKAKFEQKLLTNVMASPSPSSSVTSSNTTAIQRRTSVKQTDDVYQRNRRGSNDSLSVNRTYVDVSNGISPMSSNQIPHNSNAQYSQSSLRHINSADEADEEVQRIHRQSEELRHQHSGATSMSSFNQTKQQSSNVQYEVIDEDGNPMAIDDVHNLIKMSGVTAREVKQPNGSVLREYVIDDPTLLSRFRPQPSPIVSQARVSQNNNIPPPPPRIPLKQSMLLRQGSANTDPIPTMNIQQIRVLEPQRRYEYITTSGKRIEFMITNLGSNNQPANDADIQELANAINTRLLPTSNNIQPQQQQQFTLPKQWQPAVDLTHREVPPRQRHGSGDQPIRNKHNTAFQQVHPTQGELVRSASFGALNQGSFQQTFAPVFTEPIIDWSALQQQDPHGHIDPQLVRQFITQKHQIGGFQTSAQFLPEQQQQQEQPRQQPPPPPPPPISKSRTSSPQTNAPNFFQQPMMFSYPNQQAQQHGVTILNADNNALKQQQQQMAQQKTASPQTNASVFYQQQMTYPYPNQQQLQQQQYGATILNANLNDLNQQQQQQQPMARSRASSPQNNAPVFYQQQMSYPYPGQSQQQTPQPHAVSILNSNPNDLIQQQQQQQQSQTSRSRITSPESNAHVFYQQSMAYPYQGQQQHGVRILTNDNKNLNQQQQQLAAKISNGHARI